MTAIIALLTAVLASCGGTSGTAATSSTSPTADSVRAPQFNADSALALVQAQCAMGPRVPGTEAHKQCHGWLTEQLARHCNEVVQQGGEVTTFDGTRLTAANVVGIVNPAAEQRLLLLAHWDCRPWADNDPDPARRREPVMGANDAASGVAVLLEMARCMAAAQPAIGIDILLVDVEDWGTEGDEDSWGLGTQCWAAQPHKAGYRPMFGILLDMVGARGAQFAKEYYSMQSAGGFVDALWQVAQDSGYGNYFKPSTGHAITDDHVMVIRAGIPCMDIIDTRAMSSTGFFDGWHTTHDTVDTIDPATLKAVGQTLLNFIYSY